MLANFNRLSKAVSIAALTTGVTLSVGVAFAAPSARKDSAQDNPAIVGAGGGSVITIFDDNNPLSDPNVGYDSELWNFTNRLGIPYRYIITGSGYGRGAFRNGDIVLGQRVDFAVTDGIGTTFGANTTVRNNTIIDTVTNEPVIDPITGLHYVVVNGVNINIELATNAQFPDGRYYEPSMSPEVACRMLRGNPALGDPVNWKQVQNAKGEFGPDVPIIRVISGDVSGEAATLSNGNDPSQNNVPATVFTDSTTNVRGRYGMAQGCNNGVELYPGGPKRPPLDTFVSNPLPDLSAVDSTQTAFNNGAIIPNPRITDIAINAAATMSDPTKTDPFNAAVETGDDNNSNSYNFAVIKAIRDNNGALGPVERTLLKRAIADNDSFPLAQQLSEAILVIPSDSPTAAQTGTVIAAGPNYVIFREDYLIGGPGSPSDKKKIIAARKVCYGYLFSGFLGNQAAQLYPKQANFNINNAGGQFPYNQVGSTQQGADTDNFSPCSRIGGRPHKMR
ncbi:hypothetical protein NIES4106_54070 (plasmid) [Fischerella sp. NIES-4106]|jgi:hypothetical protein|nr:hypothetical protein NIES4106_54070 [Fischerella sp. NIES-4106]